MTACRSRLLHLFVSLAVRCCQVATRRQFGSQCEVRRVSGADLYSVLHSLRQVHLPCFDGVETPFLLHLIALLWCVPHFFVTPFFEAQ